MRLDLDKLTYAVISSSLLHDYAYTINDLEIKTGYSADQFEIKDEEYGIHHGFFIAKSDLDLIIKGFEILLKELNDNDYLNLIQINKIQGQKLLSLLKSAQSDENLNLITSDIWL
jgi:hypothetical protein